MAGMAKIVSGITKSSLFFCMSSFLSSVFSICNQSKVDFNCFTLTWHFLKSLQEQFKIHKSQRQKWGDVFNVSELGVTRAAWKSSDPTTVSSNQQVSSALDPAKAWKYISTNLYAFSANLWDKWEISQSFYQRNNHLILLSSWRS